MTYEVDWIVSCTIEAESYESAVRQAQALDPMRDGEWSGNFTVTAANGSSPESASTAPGTCPQ